MKHVVTSQNSFVTSAALLVALVYFPTGSAWSGTTATDVPSRLRIVTVNVWSGLDYHGMTMFGEYETPAKRELRFSMLLGQLKGLDPDIVLIQEANPVGCYAGRLADSLGFEEVHQVCNAGIKVFWIGPPFNFKEGIAILARKSLRLENYAAWKLSGTFGIYGEPFSFHFDDTEFALVGRITVAGKEVLIVNVHLSAFPPQDSVINRKMEEWLEDGTVTEEEVRLVPEIVSYGSSRRQGEIMTLLEETEELPAGVPIIIGGDFNSEINSAELFELSGRGKFFSATMDSGIGLYTWDPNRNSNIRYSTILSDANNSPLDFAEMVGAAYDSKPKTIDYIFLDSTFSRGAARTRVVLDSSADGIYASDHFGVMADVELPEKWSGTDSTNEPPKRSSIEPLPILSYDTDIGFGYGAKLFLFNLLKLKESFDLVVFNSTKGERWYRGVISFPDLEWREGREYPAAVDLIFDYDKWLRNNFYGIGNRSAYSNREQYTRIPFEFDFALSRGFTPQFVGQMILKYRSVQNCAFDSGSALINLLPALNASTARYVSADLNLRYDTRNSYVNPSEGIVLEGEFEFAPKAEMGNVSFTRTAAWLQYYHRLFFPPTVFCVRGWVQQVSGRDLPVQILTSVGGNNTMRGYTQDRFLDKAGALINSELRFPIFWRFGGVVGVDIGKVWDSLPAIDLGRWATNPVAGLRLYMDNYVVRADFGFGHEGTGFYFNFGQMF